MTTPEPKPAAVIRAAADLRGALPSKIGACDLLCLVGDIAAPELSPADAREWLGGPFRDWLDNVVPPDTSVVACQGPADSWYESARDLEQLGLRWRFLQDTQARVAGFAIHGASSRPAWKGSVLGDGSMTALTVGFSIVRTGVDVLLVHQTPQAEGVEAAALRRVIELRKPRVCLVSGADELGGRRRVKLGVSLVVDVSVRASGGRPVREPSVLTLLRGA